MEGLEDIEGSRRVWEDPVRFRRVREGLGGFWRVWRKWEDPGGSGRVFKGLAGSRGSWSVQ